VQTDGQPQEWLRKQGELLCSTNRGAQNGWQGASGPVQESNALAHWYSIQNLGETRVAARPVSVVALFPRDAHRYAHEFYIDTETGLLLKSLLISDRQTLLERFQFATFELGRPTDENLRSSANCVDVVVSTADEFVEEDSLTPAWLPPGFSLSHRAGWRVDDSDGRVLSQAYSDGLARFTLFIEPLTELQLAEDLRAQLGPTVAVSRRLALPQGNFLATVVGEVPAATAERIVGSFLPEQGEVRP
jgi:sigma-E factor negative regulatory protein RseB